MNLFPTIEIGIVQYPGAQLAAIHGLTDLFAFADQFAAQRLNEDRPFLRVSQWRGGAAGEVPVTCVHSVGAPPNRLTALILPPRIGPQITREEAAQFTGWLREKHDSGAILASICGGAFLLAETGLLAGRPVTTHWAHGDIFSNRFPGTHLHISKLVIDDGDIISAGGLA